MRDASVGQQCVECVGEGARSTRQARTAFGGIPVGSAVVTWTLVAINVAIFLVTWVRPGIVNDLAMLGYAPYTPVGPLHGVAAGEWYRLITSAFVAPATGLSGLGFLDILFNMWALVFVGPSLEGCLGRVRFLAVYLLSAVGGAVMYYFLAPPNSPAVGASGAIFGLFGAWFVVSRRLRLDTRGIVVLIAINLALSFFFHNAIAWQAHIGGLLTGALLTAAYAYAPRKNRAVVQAAATVAVVALIVGRGRDQERPDHQRRLLALPRPRGLAPVTLAPVKPGAGQCHLVARTTAAMMNAKPTRRFHAPRAERPGIDPPAR